MLCKHAYPFDILYLITGMVFTLLYASRATANTNLRN
jgi:hypothetical protein